MAIDAPDWVAERMGSRPSDLFNELCRVVERDVESMNGQSRRHFDVSGGGPRDECILVSHGNPFVRFELEDDKIIVTRCLGVRGNETRIVVTPTWDGEARTHRLGVSSPGDFPTELGDVWQISQLALEPLFFPDA